MNEGPPSRSTSWYDEEREGRDWRVIAGSFWRRLPAAALRGLANSFCPGGALTVVQLDEVRLGEEDLTADLDAAAASPASVVGHVGDSCGRSR